MNSRFLALALACAGLAAGVALPAAGQGLRSTPQIGVRTIPRADAGPQPADYIVAVVNSEPITNNEVRRRMVRYEQQLAAQGSPLPPRAQLAREVLDRLITEKAQLQVARETGIKVDDATVDQAEQTVARQNNIDVNELRRRVVAEGLSPAQFRDDLRNQILLQRVRDRELQSRAKVTELDVDEYLRDQQNAPDPALVEMNLAHILVAVPENATPEQVAQAKAKADKLLERARAGEDFAKLAREGSDAAGAAQNGGVLGLRPADRLPPLFVQAASNLPQGGVSDVLRSQAGFHIVKVLEKRAASKAGMSVTQSHARHILLRPNAQMSEAQARQKLADFKRRILAGQADFATLARENSQDASAKNGGDLGWASAGMFVPEFDEVLDSLQPGQISDPITTRFGVHLIQLIERRQATLSPREQREVARNLVREKKLDEAYARWTQEVRGRAYVELREPPQ
ncbi:peptidylprolyl isomerase [Ramlibacter ginsenosidimutans]|uniref:Chaperone SurA n=1 Tax=Ramlibacter ginsenosidimutans TaxID=502333 RepID=A0A934TQY2_9BURK|nr:peptidylprolyl isomerase [Ramlibacter ginsenosidimutans]MBK6005709.1 peptidylprolyl isomerase [Ramlibacter ginsenosidimutans]